MGASSLLWIVAMYGGWSLGMYALRYRRNSALVSTLTRLWDSTRFFFILAATLGICIALNISLPAVASLPIAVALVGCALAGFEFGRSREQR